MRYGQERSGLFGVKSMSNGGEKVGLTYTMGGIYWEADKDLQIGHWAVKKDENGEIVKAKVKVPKPEGTGGETVEQEKQYMSM